MKLSLNSTLAALVLTVPLFASAAEYEIDTQHAFAEFGVKHLGVSTVKGRFSNITGTVNVDEKDITKSTVQATIDATTVNTGIDARDGHLKSPDFFDVAKFPTLTFKSTKVEKSGDDLKVTGDLTIHGVTKPVVLDAEVGPDTVSINNIIKRGVSATTKINRKDFGLNWNKAVGPNFAVGDDIKIELNFEVNKKATGATPPAAPAPAPVKK